MSDGSIELKDFKFSHTVYGDPKHDRIFKAVQVLERLSISENGSRIYQEHAAARVSKIFADIIIPHVLKQSGDNIISSMFPTAGKLFVEAHKRAGWEVTNVRSGRYRIVGSNHIKVDTKISSGAVNFNDLHIDPNLKFYYYLDESQTPPVCYVNNAVAMQYKIDVDGDEIFILTLDGKRVKVNGENIAKKRTLALKNPLHAPFTEVLEDTEFNVFDSMKTFKGPKSLASGFKFGITEEERKAILKKHTSFTEYLSNESFSAGIAKTLKEDNIGLYENRVYAQSMYNALKDYEKFSHTLHAKSLLHQGYSEEDIHSAFMSQYGRGELVTPHGIVDLRRTAAMGDLEGPMFATKANQNIIEEIIKSVQRGKEFENTRDITQFAMAVEGKSDFKLGFSPNSSYNHAMKLVAGMLNNGLSVEELQRRFLTPSVSDFVYSPLTKQFNKKTAAAVFKGDSLNIVNRLQKAGMLDVSTLYATNDFVGPVTKAHVVSLTRVDDSGNIVKRVLNQSTPNVPQGRVSGSVFGAAAYLDDEGEVQLGQALDRWKRSVNIEISNNPDRYLIHSRQLSKASNKREHRVMGEMIGEMDPVFLKSDKHGAAAARRDLARANKISEERLLSILHNDPTNSQLKHMVIKHDHEYHSAQTQAMKRIMSDHALLNSSEANLYVHQGQYSQEGSDTNRHLSMIATTPEYMEGGVRYTETTPEGKERFALRVRRMLNEKGHDLAAYSKSFKDKDGNRLKGGFKLFGMQMGGNVWYDPHSKADPKRVAGAISQAHTEVKGVFTVLVDEDMQELLKSFSDPEAYMRNVVATREGGLNTLSSGIGLGSEELLEKISQTETSAPFYGSERDLSKKLSGGTIKQTANTPQGFHARYVHADGHEEVVHLVQGVGEAIDGRDATAEIARLQSQFYDEHNGGNTGSRAFARIMADKENADLEAFHQALASRTELRLYNGDTHIHTVYNPVAFKQTVYLMEKPQGSMNPLEEHMGGQTISNAKSLEAISSQTQDGLSEDAFESAKAFREAQRGEMHNDRRGEAASLLHEVRNFYGVQPQLNQQVHNTVMRNMENSKAVRLGALTALEDLAKIRL